jgi:hypothetical protein
LQLTATTKVTNLLKSEDGLCEGVRQALINLCLSVCLSVPSAHSALEWRVLTESLPLALMLRYMLRSQAPIVLTDR